MHSLGSFWNEESGSVVSAELVIIGAMVAVGAVTGLQAVSTAVDDESQNVAQAIRSLDQSYSYRGFRGCSSMTAGSAFVDQSVDVMGDRRANSPGGNQHQSSVQAPNTSLDSSEPDPESVDEQEPREREGIQDED